MILRELKNYLRTVKIANIRELSLYLRAQPDAVRAMAEFLIRKNYIRKIEPDVCESGCQSCKIGFVEIYEWVSDMSSNVPLR